MSDRLEIPKKVKLAVFLRAGGPENVTCEGCKLRLGGKPFHYDHTVPEVFQMLPKSERVITADEAYSGLRPEVLMLIAGMVVLGIALDVTGLAADGTRILIGTMEGMSPLFALIILYGVTLFATELLSNATVAVLFTPVAVSMAEAFGVSPRPFLVAIMIAASAAFATPFGYQTNVVVYQMCGYNYLDFVKVGIPLNLITRAAAVVPIQMYFPF
jgi:di/tricarboxylate transporter